MNFNEWKQLKWATLEKVTLEQAEQEHMYPDDGRVPHVPFGFGNEKWLKAKAQLREGDEIYYFCSSPESWQNLAGREGYAFVRGDEIIHTFTTTMN